MRELSYSALWGIAVIAFSVIEGATSGLVSIWFAIGAVVGLIASLLGVGIMLQFILFILVSVVSFIVLRRWAIKSVGRKTAKTDIDRIVGEKVIIRKTVDNNNNSGSVTINDVEWKVKSSTGEIINEGESVTVEGIEGVKLLVRR